MKRIFSLLGCGGVILAAANLTPNVCAADDSGDVAYQPFSLGAEAGTTGFGGAASWRFADHLGVRAGMNYFSYTDKTREVEGIKYNAKLKLMSEPIGIDFYPWKARSFRITAGVLINQNQLEGVVPQDQVFGRTFIDINGTLQDSAAIGDLNMKVKQLAVSPYLAIGGNFYFDKAKRWSLSGELGVAYTGSPDVTLTTGNPGTVPQQDLNAEARQIEDAAKKFQFYPILKLGVNFSF